MSDLPTQAEELERKATAAISNAAHRLGTGQITAIEFRTMLDGIYDTISGLVPRAFMDWMVELRKVELLPFLERRTFHKPGTNVVVTLKRELGECVFTSETHALNSGELMPRAGMKSYATPEECSEGLRKLTLEMVKNGWREL